MVIGMSFIGIDPGASGGIAAINENAECVWKMPETERDIWDLIEPFGAAMNPVCLIEQLGAMPRGKPDESGNTTARQSPTSMMSMGRNYGGLRMALIAAGVRFEEVLPRRWQSMFGLLSRPGESKTDKKNRHKAKAQQLFPGIKVTHAVADALLIAEYARRTHHPAAAAG